MQQLDNNKYSDNDLIEVKVALHTPYLTNWPAYERVDGEMEVNGIYYNYVKRKIYNDTLYLLCVPNKSKTELHAGRTEYAKKVQDMPSNGKNAGASHKKYAAASEYSQSIAQFSLAIPSPIINPQYGRPVSSIIHSFVNSPFHPPRL